MTHEKILFLYISAVERGDLEALTDIWKLAEDDPKLSAKLIEINAEMGDTPMAVYNGKVQRINSPERRTKSFNIPYTRVAILMLLMAGIIGVALSLSQAHDNDEVNSVPLYGTTPTPAGPENLTVLTKDNVDEMVQIERYGSGIVNGAVWSHDGSQIIAYGESLLVFDADTTPIDHYERIELPFIADRGVLAGDGTQLAIANHFGQSAVIDLNDGLSRLMASVDGKILDITAHQNLVARADIDNNLVYVWDLEAGRERIVIRSLDDNVNALAFSEDGSMLAVSGSVRKIGGSTVLADEPGLEHVIQVFDTESWEILYELDNPAKDFPYTSIAFNGNRLYAYFAPIFHWWDLDNLTNTLPAGEGSTTAPDAQSFTFTDDGSRIIAAVYGWSPASLGAVIDAETFEWLGRYSSPDIIPRNMDVIDNRILFVTQHAIRVFDLEERQEIQSVPHLPARPFDMVVRYPYAAVHDGSSVTVYDLEAGVQVNAWSGGIRDITFTPDGTVLGIAVPYYSNQKNVVLWDFVNDTTQGMGDTAREPIALDRTGMSLAYATITGELKVIDLDTKTEISSIRVSFGTEFTDPHMDIHPSSPEVVITQWSHQIEVFDIETESLLHTLTGHSDVVTNLSFSHNGSIMASVDLSGYVIIWDTETWQEIAYRSLGMPGGNLAFSPDDGLLAVSSERDIVVLDVDTLETLHQFQGNDDYITGLDFDDSGKMLLSAGHDGVLRTWGIPE